MGDRLFNSDYEHPLQPHPLNELASKAPVPGQLQKKVSLVDGHLLDRAGLPDSATAAAPQQSDVPTDPLVFGDGGPVARKHRAADDLVAIEGGQPSPAELAASAAAQTAAAAASRFRGRPTPEMDDGDPLLSPTPPSQEIDQTMEEFGLYDAPFDEIDGAQLHHDDNNPFHSNQSHLSGGLREDIDVAFDSSSGERNSAGSFIIRSQRSRLQQLRGPARESNSLQVTRTIADFLWLEDRLRLLYDTLIIPALPPMNVTGRIRFGYAYVDARRRGFERFLRRVTNHAELAAAEEVSAFLGLEGEKVWEQIRSAPRPPTGHPANSIQALTTQEHPSLMAEIQAQLVRYTEWATHGLWQTGRQLNRGVGSFLTKRHDFESSHDQRDDQMQRLRAYVGELTKSLHTLKRSVERANTKQGDLSRAESLLEGSLKRVAVCEGGRFQDFVQEFAGRVETQASLNKSSVPGSLLSSDSAEWQLHEVLGDFVQRSEGAHRLVTQRLEEQELYERKLKVYRKQRDQIDCRIVGSEGTEQPASHGSSGPSIARSFSGKDLTQLQTSLASAASDLAATRKHYETVAISTNAELRRFRLELHQEMTSVLAKLARDKMRKHQEIADNWKQFLDVVEHVGEKSVQT